MLSFSCPFKNFEKYYFDQILVEQRKAEVLLKNPAIFQIFFLKNQGKAQDFWNIFSKLGLLL
jgi:hypothetical protein